MWDELVGALQRLAPMERCQINDQAAFPVLVRTSQYSNRKLRDVARILATTGTIELTPGIEDP